MPNCASLVSSPRLPQRPVQISHLCLHLLDAALEPGEEVVLELLHRALARRPDLAAVTRQLALLERTALRVEFVVVERLRAERARRKALGIRAARREQTAARGLRVLLGLLTALGKRMEHIFRLFQPRKLHAVTRHAGFITVRLGVLPLEQGLHLALLAVLSGQDLICQLTDALVELTAERDLLLLLPAQRMDLPAQALDQRFLLLDPHQIDMPALLLERRIFLAYLLDAQVIALPFGHDLLHEIRQQERLLLPGQHGKGRLPACKLVLELRCFLLETADAQRDRVAADKGVIHPLAAERTGDIALIQHTLIRDGGPIPAQLLNRVAAHHAPEQIIHVGSRKRVSGLHLFRKTAALRVDMLTLAQRADIDQTVGVQAFFPLEFVVNTQSLLVICRFNQKIKLLVVEIAFHGTAPALIFNFQHIRENIYRNRRSRLLLQFLLQLGTERQQSARIVLDVSAQIGKRSLLFGQLLLQLCNLIAKPIGPLRC